MEGAAQERWAGGWPVGPKTLAAQQVIEGLCRQGPGKWNLQKRCLLVVGELFMCQACSHSCLSLPVPLYMF